jgi:hypothetical protein
MAIALTMIVLVVIWYMAARRGWLITSGIVAALVGMVIAGSAVRESITTIGTSAWSVAATVVSDIGDAASQ